MRFKVKAPYEPAGDQPKAIEKISKYLEEGKKYITLLGVTGSGKTFTMAKVVEKINRPTLVLTHNKTLASQLYIEFKEFFPDNAVCYFVSYYDYYQPEAYIPQRDLYIEKDSSINEKIEQLRMQTIESLLTRRDVLVVATVSCLYGIGNPKKFKEMVLDLKVGQIIDMKKVIEKLVAMQYKVNQITNEPGTFSFRGQTLTIAPKSMEDEGYRIEFFDDEIETIYQVNFLTGQREKIKAVRIFPATSYILVENEKEKVVASILEELEERLKYFEESGKLLEYQRLKQRTEFDIATINVTGSCKGIENYARHIDGRNPGEPPMTLLDYFPPDWLLFIDESHITIPQLHAMRRGDRARKKNLVDYGFRLPSAYDNRPLSFEEFWEKINQVVFVSATPAEFELEKSKDAVVELVVRPTGLLDPLIEIKPTSTQVEDLILNLKELKKKKQKAIVAVLTKKQAEKLSQYLKQYGIRAAWLHSNLDTIERTKVLNKLRKDIYDCVVGINLLREGIDLPEVSTIFILDADKEGFLRSKTSLVQLAGRAARNVEGKVILYADRITPSIRYLMERTERFRKKQEEYNREHGIIPKTVKKDVKDLIDEERDFDENLEENLKELYVSILKEAEQLNFKKAEQLKDEFLAICEKHGLDYRRVMKKFEK